MERTMDKSHLKDKVWTFLQAWEKLTSAQTHTEHQCQSISDSQTKHLSV